MYLQNKYTTWYHNIIANANKRINQPGYFEKHHIIPKSLGGTNDPSNLVKLTAREHFICHLLLPKMLADPVQKRSMYYASYLMLRGLRVKHFTPSSKIYEIARKHMSQANKDRPGPNLGKKFSNETKKKQSDLRKGVPLGPMSEEHKAKVGRYERTSEHRDAISKSRKAQTGLQKRSEETKSKMSAWQKGIPKPTITCQHCRKTTSDLNHRRWHGKNCKTLQNKV
jgi:hypothetical protein